jgi:hypothetical protein
MKTCKSTGCISPVFSHLYCQRHQYLRTDAKKPQRVIKARSDKKPVHAINFGFDNQIDMFHALWENAKDKNGIVRCQYTGEHLNCFYGTEMWFSCFLHVLSKKNYPYFKLNPFSVEIAFPEFHRIVDQGTLKDRAKHPNWKWDLWDSKVIQMKEEYRKFKQQHLLP